LIVPSRCRKFLLKGVAGAVDEDRSSEFTGNSVEIKPIYLWFANFNLF